MDKIEAKAVELKSVYLDADTDEPRFFVFDHFDDPRLRPDEEVTVTITRTHKTVRIDYLDINIRQVVA